jgi:hypothetical protein
MGRVIDNRIAQEVARNAMENENNRLAGRWFE